MVQGLARSYLDGCTNKRDDSVVVRRCKHAVLHRAVRADKQLQESYPLLRPSADMS